MECSKERRKAFNIIVVETESRNNNILVIGRMYLGEMGIALKRRSNPSVSLSVHDAVALSKIRTGYTLNYTSSVCRCTNLLSDTHDFSFVCFLNEKCPFELQPAYFPQCRGD